MNKFDTNPYRERISYDEKKILEMFNLIENMDMNELLIFSTKNKIPLNLSTKSGETLIHIVVRMSETSVTEKSKLNMCKFLIAHDVPYDSPNKDNISPLHIACQLQLETIIKLLLENDADINRQDNIGNTPMHYLLSGIIKNYEIREVVNIIPPKKKNNKLNEIYIKIKDSMKDFIDNNMQSLPILETLKNTFENILEYDKNIEVIILDIITKQKEILTDTQSSNDVNLIYKIAANSLKQYIIDKVQINPLDDIKLIANPKSDDLIIDNFGIIENGANIKREIKKEIKKNIDSINKLNINNSMIDPPSITDIVESLEEKNTVNTLTDFTSIYNDYKHINAFDYASPIINFEELTFMGGARNLKINEQINNGLTINTVENKRNLLTALGINNYLTGDNNFTATNNIINTFDASAILNTNDLDRYFIMDFIQLSSLLTALYDVSNSGQIDIILSSELFYKTTISKYNINLFSQFEEDIYKMYSLTANGIDNNTPITYMKYEELIIHEFMQVFIYMVFNCIHNFTLFNEVKIALISYYKDKDKHVTYKPYLINVFNLIREIYDNLNIYYSSTDTNITDINNDNYLYTEQSEKKNKLQEIITNLKIMKVDKYTEYQLTNIIVENLANIFKYLQDENGQLYTNFTDINSPIMKLLEKIYDIFDTNLKYFGKYKPETVFNFYNLFLKSYMFLFRLNYATLMIKILEMYNESKQSEWLLTIFSIVNCLNSHNNLEGNIDDSTLVLIGSIGSLDKLTFTTNDDRFKEIMTKYKKNIDVLKKIDNNTQVIIKTDYEEIIIEYNNLYYKSIFINLIYHKSLTTPINNIYKIETGKEYPSSSKNIYDIECKDIWSVSNYNLDKSLSLMDNQIKSFIGTLNLKVIYDLLQKNSLYLNTDFYDIDFTMNTKPLTIYKQEKRCEFILLIFTTIKQSINIIKSLLHETKATIAEQTQIIDLISTSEQSLYTIDFKKIQFTTPTTFINITNVYYVLLNNLLINIYYLKYTPPLIIHYVHNTNDTDVTAVFSAFKLDQFTNAHEHTIYNLLYLMNENRDNRDKDEDLLIFERNLLKIITFELYPTSNIQLNGIKIKSLVALLLALPGLDVNINKTFESINKYNTINDSTLYDTNITNNAAQPIFTAVPLLPNIAQLQTLFNEHNTILVFIYDLFITPNNANFIYGRIIGYLGLPPPAPVVMINYILKLNYLFSKQMSIIMNRTLPHATSIIKLVTFKFLNIINTLKLQKENIQYISEFNLIINNSIVLSNSLISTFLNNTYFLTTLPAPRTPQQIENYYKERIQHVCGFSSIYIYSLIHPPQPLAPVPIVLNNELIIRMYNTGRFTSDIVLNKVKDIINNTQAFDSEKQLIRNGVNVFNNLNFTKISTLWHSSLGVAPPPNQVHIYNERKLAIDLINSVATFLDESKNVDPELVIEAVIKAVTDQHLKTYPEVFSYTNNNVYVNIDIALAIILKTIIITNDNDFKKILFKSIEQITQTLQKGKVYRTSANPGSNVLSGIYGNLHNQINWGNILPINNNIMDLIDNEIYAQDNLEFAEGICDHILDNAVPAITPDNKMKIKSRAMFLRAVQNTTYLSQSIEYFTSTNDTIIRHINNSIDKGILAIISTTRMNMGLGVHPPIIRRSPRRTNFVPLPVPVPPIVPLNPFNDVVVIRQHTNFDNQYIINISKSIVEEVTEVLAGKNASLVLNSIIIASEQSEEYVNKALIATLTTSISTASTLGVTLNIPNLVTTIKNKYNDNQVLDTIIYTAIEASIIRFNSSKLFDMTIAHVPLPITDVMMNNVKNLLSFNKSTNLNLYNARNKLKRPGILDDYEYQDNQELSDDKIKYLKLKYSTTYMLYKLNNDTLLGPLIIKIQEEFNKIDNTSTYIDSLMNLNVKDDKQISHLFNLYNNMLDTKTEQQINSMYKVLTESDNIINKTNIKHEGFMSKKIDNNYKMALLLGLHYQGTLHYTIHDDLTPSTHYLEDSKLQKPFNYWSIPQNRHIVDKVNFYNTYENENENKYIIPTINNYNYTLSKLNYYVEENTKDQLKSIQSIISGILLNTKELGKVFTEHYPNILYNCKIIETNNIYINSQSKRTSVFRYQELAEYLNLINANYFIYYYIFDSNSITKLSRFNYYQLPIYEKTKPIEFQLTYYNEADITKPYDMIIDDTNDRLPLPLPGSKTNVDNIKTNVVYNYGLYKRVYDNYLTKGYTNHIIQPNATAYLHMKSEKLPQSLYNHIGLFFKYSMKQLLKEIAVCITTTPPLIPPPLVTNCQKLIELKSAIEMNLDYQIPTKHKNHVSYGILFKVIESYFIDVCKSYINIASIKRFNKIMNNKDDISKKLSDMNDNILSSFKTPNISNMLESIMKEQKNIINNTGIENKLILHCNFSNSIILKNKNYIYIKENIIKNILENNIINLSIENINGNSCLYSLLEYNTNYKDILKQLINNYNFNKMENKKPLNFIEKELNNLIFKFYGEETYKSITLKDVYENIHGELYKSIENYILSNEEFGNNILKNIESGFNFLTLTILSEIKELPNVSPPTLSSSLTDDLTSLLTTPSVALKVPNSEKYSIIFNDINDKTYETYNSENIENYFIHAFYKTNKILENIHKILIYTIKIIFCKNIKETISETINKTFTSSSEIIYYIMTNTDKNNKSLNDIIDELPEPLIRTHLKIYEDKYDKDTYTSSSIKDILNNIFDQLYNYEDIIGKELIDNMKLHYVNYYETLIIKILPLLLVNCENILKFFIVLNRLKEIRKILK